MANVVPILDIPEPDPGAGFAKIIDTLESAVINAKRGHLTIGVFGRYGSGKTTLLRGIEKKLKDKNDPKLLVVSFSAWRYDHEEHLFLPFLAAMHRNDAIWKNPCLSNRFHAARRAFIKGLTLEVGTPIGKLGFSGDKALSEEDELLKDRLAKASGDYVDVYTELEKVPLADDGELGFRIVVFVDDLDRCVPGKAFALLEQLKSLMDMDGYVFLIGLDPRSIGRTLQEKHSAHLVTLDEYLEKMFQMPYYIAPLQDKDVSLQIKEYLERLGKAGADKSWLDSVASASGDLSGYWPCNYRRVKRILNAHQILCINRNEDRPRLLLGLLVLATRWPLAHKALRLHGKPFLEALFSCNKRDGYSLPECFAENDATQQTLKDKSLLRLFENFILPAAEKENKMEMVTAYAVLIGVCFDDEFLP